jgi:hypothetical protein
MLINLNLILSQNKEQKSQSFYHKRLAFLKFSESKLLRAVTETDSSLHEFRFFFCWMPKVAFSSNTTNTFQLLFMWSRLKSLPSNPNSLLLSIKTLKHG